MAEGGRPNILVIWGDDIGITAATNRHAEPIVITAQRLGWTVASMRTDWKQIFAPAGALSSPRGGNDPAAASAPARYS